MKKYIYTNKSTYEHLQKMLDDTAITGAVLYEQGGYDTIEAGGKPEIIGKSNGVSRPEAQHTVCFDVVHPKVGEDGAWCLNPRHYYADEPWVGLLPDFDTYTGLFQTDDVSEWIESIEEI